MFKKIKNKKGFTLTELIVVIVIIGILAAVLIPSLTGYITKANKSVDEQKVASLNKLLIEAQVNEKDFSDAIELKEYLEDEMDYDGDYSLKVEGSYMWYDTLKRKIVIIDDDDEKMNLSTATVTPKLLSNGDTFKFVTNGNDLKSPEGLMQYNNLEKDEVWLIGGNGYLFDLVEEIRNIGNNGSGELSEYTKLDSNNKVKNVLQDYFKKVFFSGTEGNFNVDENGKITEATETENKTEIKASQESDLAKLFHKEVIEDNIAVINSKLKSDNAPVELELKDHTLNIIFIASNEITKTADAVYEVIKLLKENGCESGWVFPERYGTLSEYQKVFDNIIEGYKNYNGKNDDNTISSELYNYLGKALGGKDINSLSEDEIGTFMEQFYKVDLSKINSSNTSELISNFLPIIVALKLEENTSDGKTVYNFSFEGETLSIDIFKDKEPIRLIGKIESKKYGKFNAQYDFVFDTSRITKNNEE